jgi:hypothetical protein
MIKTAKFNGKVYDIHIGKIDGMCDSPSEKDNTPSLVIALEPADTHRYFETCLHEALHASSFSTHEETVERTAKEVTRFLRRLGFKWQEKDAGTDT